MFPRNLNLSIGKVIGYNNQILISNADMKIDPNKDINKAIVYHQKLPVTPPEPRKAEVMPLKW